MERRLFLKNTLMGAIPAIFIPKIKSEKINKPFIFQSFFDRNKYEFMECDDLNVYLGISEGTIRYHIFTTKEWIEYEKGFRKLRSAYECRHLEYSSSMLSIKWNIDQVDVDGNHNGKTIFIDSDFPLKTYSSIKDYKSKISNDNYKIYKI